MDAGKKQRRGRRSFSDEFKAGAVRLVLDEGKTISQVRGTSICCGRPSSCG